MSGTISPRDRLQLWVNTFLLKQKENSGSVTATFRDLETIPEVAIPGHRLREAPSTPLTADEVAACRAALGALQWVSSQTQIQACARVNLLLTELTVNRNMQVAKEINDLIKEIRSNPMVINIHRLPQVQQTLAGLRDRDTCRSGMGKPATRWIYGRTPDLHRWPGDDVGRGRTPQSHRLENMAFETQSHQHK